MDLRSSFCEEDGRVVVFLGLVLVSSSFELDAPGFLLLHVLRCLDEWS